MKKTNFEIKFYQHHLSGDFEYSDNQSDYPISLFNHGLEHGCNGDEKNFVANMVSMFCSPSEEMEENMEYIVTSLFGAYFLKNPDKQQEDELVIDLSELLESFGCDVQEVIDSFGIFVMTPNSVQSFDVDDFDSLPPVIQKVILAAKDGNIESGIMEFNQLNGNVQIVNQEEFDALLGKGGYELEEAQGQALIEGFLKESELATHETHNTVQ